MGYKEQGPLDGIWRKIAPNIFFDYSCVVSFRVKLVIFFLWERDMGASEGRKLKAFT
jgi:hypothetical protein